MTFWIQISWGLTALATLALAGALVWTYRQHRQALRLLDEMLPAEFSVASYSPVEHLLADEDFIFLQRQPGYRPEIGERWKRERRRIVRMYLDQLSADFCFIHQTARRMVADSGPEASAMVGALMKQQMEFWRAMAALRVRLALQDLGIGRVNVRPLLEFVEASRAGLVRIDAPHAA